MRQRWITQHMWSVPFSDDTFYLQAKVFPLKIAFGEILL